MMTPEQFTYWLQGFCELTTEAPTVAQWKLIKEHLELVFEKKTSKLEILDDDETEDDPFSPFNGMKKGGLPHFCNGGGSGSRKLC